MTSIITKWPENKFSILASSWTPVSQLSLLPNWSTSLSPDHASAQTKWLTWPKIDSLGSPLTALGYFWTFCSNINRKWTRLWVIVYDYELSFSLSSMQSIGTANQIRCQNKCNLLILFLFVVFLLIWSPGEYDKVVKFFNIGVVFGFMPIFEGFFSDRIKRRISLLFWRFSCILDW